MTEALSSVLVAGSSNPELANEVAEKLALPLFPLSILRFPDGELRVQLEEEVLGKQVFVLQSLSRNPNDRLVETLLMVDALRRGGAREIVLVCPYLGYSRQSVQERKGVSVAARLFADFLQEAGVTQLITMDLHAELVRSFYNFPVEPLTARSELIKEFYQQGHKSEDFVVVGPDLGGAKLASAYANELSCPLALFEKRRHDARKVTIRSLIGDVEGKNVLLADDVCSTAGTLASAAKACHEKGAKNIFAVVTHGIFCEDAVKVIEQSPIKRLFVSNTIRQEKDVLSCQKICVVSCASTFAAAISRLLDRLG